MQQKISYEIFSERGKYHEEQGKENEDAINIVTNGNYVFAILSDGAGSSKFAKEASETTVKACSDFCFENSKKLFNETEITVKKLIFDIQTSLEQKATEVGIELSDMICTLVILGINKSTNKYVTIHVGDGLIALNDNKKWNIISYPENGATKQYTYFVNSPFVFKHLRVYKGKFNINDEFFISSDGYFENCNFTEEYINCLSKSCPKKHNDDTTYCQMKFQMI